MISELPRRKQTGGRTTLLAGAGPWTLASLVALVACALFVVTVCPTVPFGDGGELIAAADCLGVAHPPGYPLYTLLGWLALQFPAGEPALRMNLLSALLAAIACGAVAWLLMGVTGSRAAAAAAGLGLAVSSTFWWVATVTEVYALHLLLLVVLLAAAAALGQATGRAARTRALMAGAVALGLGLGHHPTILVALPAAMILAWRAPREASGRAADAVLPSRWVAAATLTLLLPALLDLSLMARARAGPPSNWGRPTTLDALWPHVTAAAYQHINLGLAGLTRVAAWKQLGQLVLAEFTPAILPLALVGLAGWPGPGPLSRWGRLRLALAALIALSAGFGLCYATEDVEVFYLPAFVGLALGAGAGVALLRRQERRAPRWAGLVAAALLVLVPAAGHARARQLRGVTGAADYGRDILRTVPQGGVLFVEVDDSFMVLYLHQVLGERSDVTVYDRNGVLFHDLALEVPLAMNPGEPWRSYRIRIEQAFIGRELSRARPRDILFLGWPGYEVPPQYRLEPVGLLYRICRSQDPLANDVPVWSAYHEAGIRAQAARVDNAFALAVAATYPLARGERALFLGDRARAYAAFEEAGRLAGRTAGVHNYIGTLYGRIGDYSRAIAAFRRSLEIKPVSVRAWNNLALAYQRAGNVEGARQAWTRSLELIAGQEEVLASLREIEPRP